MNCDLFRLPSNGFIGGLVWSFRYCRPCNAGVLGDESPIAGSRGGSPVVGLGGSPEAEDVL